MRLTFSKETAGRHYIGLLGGHRLDWEVEYGHPQTTDASAGLDQWHCESRTQHQRSHRHDAGHQERRRDGGGTFLKKKWNVIDYAIGDTDNDNNDNDNENDHDDDDNSVVIGVAVVVSSTTKPLA